MAHNDPSHPELARAAQDVEHPPEPEAMPRKHFGRGGAANVVGQDGQVEEARREGSPTEKGFLEKGMELLNKLGRK